MSQMLEPLLRDHRFFTGADPEHLAMLAGCAQHVAFPLGAYLFRAGTSADRFFLIRDGVVALETSAAGGVQVVVQTLGAGDVAGFSWLIERRSWQFDGRAVERTRAVELDGACLRWKCRAEPKLGFELMQRFARLACDRLQATRQRVVDEEGYASAR